MTDVFTFLPLERVLYGPGSVSQLSAEVDRLGASRALIITGKTLANETPLIRQVASLLGEQHAGTFTGVRQHVPESDVADAAATAKGRRVDLLVSVGGGSPIDAAKAVAWAMAGDDGPPPHVAIPTTLSAAEYSHVAGYTVEGSTREKDRHVDPRLTPRSIILDPQMTLHTPDWLWSSSGIRALDHAVETLYAPGDHTVQDVLALQAIRDLFRCLPAAHQDPDDVAVRQQGQLAAWMSYFAPAAIKLGLSHKLSKSFGTTHGVPHGITSCITLPPVMRHMAATHAGALARMARTLGVAGPETPEPEAALAAADAVADLVRRLELPGRLRDVDVPHGAIPDIARRAGGQSSSHSELVSILEAAW